MGWPVHIELHIDWKRGLRRLHEAAELAVHKKVVASVDQTQTADAHVDAHVLHDVLVNAGARLDGQAIAVKIGAPRLVSSTTVQSPDGAFIDREDHIEVTLSITTKERLALFLDAIAGATVDDATLTLTPRPTAAPTIHVNEERP